jgi:hypothetical protein
MTKHSQIVDQKVFNHQTIMSAVDKLLNQADDLIQDEWLILSFFTQHHSVVGKVYDGIPQQITVTAYTNGTVSYDADGFRFTSKVKVAR